MSTFTVKARLRDDMGKGASRRLRQAGLFPAVVYGGNQASMNLSIDHIKFLHQLDNEAFYSSILNLDIEGNSEHVMLKDLQRHPYKPQILHADFQRIDDENAVIVYVPFHFTNEIACIGVKQDGGLISHRINGVKVSCSANDLPEYIEVDMADVHLGKILHLSDIVLPKGVRIRGLRKGSNNDLPVSTVVKLKGR